MMHADVRFLILPGILALHRASQLRFRLDEWAIGMQPERTARLSLSEAQLKANRSIDLFLPD
jgi:hypothetical protein